jgi:putative spermidine/putrescine transport system ATP-binding protein
MTSDSYLRLRNLVKSYDGRANAVDGVSIDVAKGEFLTFLGPSGSGKTSTLLMIAGFETATSGDIELGGRSLAQVRPHRRSIGMVFQNYALFPHMTVARNVAFPLRMRKFPKADIAARVVRALSLVELDGFSERHPRELSGGQQQRVALARALVFEPDILLLDEPLGALDKNLREQMQVEIRRIHAEVGITTIYVTHDQTEAMTMSDRIAVFSRGRVEQIASPIEMYARPATPFVGKFIGDSNFFEGVLRSNGRLEVGGLGDIRAPTGSSATPGGRVHVLIRPENIRVVADGEAAHGLDVFQLAIDGAVNYGDSVLFMGRINGQPLRVRMPGARAGTLLHDGRLRVGWQPDDVHLIPRD